MILKKYLSNLYSSISSVSYYGKIIKEPFLNSFLFFIVSMIIIGATRGSYVALTKLPELKSNSYLALDDLEQHFDKDLEIIWADQQLELNQENVKVYWPSTINHTDYDLPNTVAIISNSEEPPSSELLDETTLVYINKNNFYTVQDIEKKEWAEYPLKDVLIGSESYSINKQTLPKITSSIRNVIDQSFTKIQLGVAIFSIFIFIFSRIWFLVTESIFVYFLFKIYTLMGTKNLNFSFEKILKLGLNILVPTEIIHLVSSTFYAKLNLPMDSISFWVILTFVIFNLRKKTNK